jgi:hypothetical protein
MKRRLSNFFLSRASGDGLYCTRGNIHVKAHESECTDIPDGLASIRCQSNRNAE